MKSKEELKIEIEGVLAIVRQGLAMHGGNVELVDVEPETGKVLVRLQGSCVGCPMSELTLKAGIEDTLMGMVPEVTEVVNIDASPEDEDDSCCETSQEGKIGPEMPAEEPAAEEVKAAE